MVIFCLFFIFRRLLTLIAGWSAEDTFAAGDYFFWIPLLLPHVGGLLGAGLYKLMVGLHHPEDQDEVDPESNGHAKRHA